MNIQRLCLLIVAIVLITVGASLSVQNTERSLQFAGVLVRVGLMLFVIWIAYPDLDSLKDRSTLFTWIVIIVVIVFAAANSKIFPIAAGVALATIFLNGLLRRLSGKNIKKPKKNRESTKNSSQ